MADVDAATNGIPGGTDNDDDEGADNTPIDSSKLVSMTFTLSVPSDFDLLKHNTRFGIRGEKGKVKDEKGEMIRKYWTATVQFENIQDLVKNALANVNVSLRRVIDTGLWPREGIPLVNSSGKFVTPEKSLEEIFAEVLAKGDMNEIAKLVAFFDAQRALYEAKALATKITVTEPIVVINEPETVVASAPEMTDEELEAATKPLTPPVEPKVKPQAKPHKR